MLTTSRIADFAAPASDLRRRRTRELSETLVSRARFALPDDRALIEAVYQEGLSATQLAALRDQTPRTIRRRIRAIASQLLCPRFTIVINERDRWPVKRRRIATACILQGRTLREAAKHLNLTLHTVRTEMAVINALCDARAAVAARPHQNAQAAHFAPRAHNEPACA